MESRFSNQTTNQRLTVACAMADAILNPGSKLIQVISEKHDWKYGTNMSGEQVAVRLCQRPLEPIKVMIWRPWNPFTRAIAYTDGDFMIHFNIYKLEKLETLDMIGTLTHELSHLMGFKHGNNYRTKDKESFSVPYWLTVNAWRHL